MNKGLLTVLFCLTTFANFIWAQNPNGDLRIQMLDYWNLVIDHNIQTPAGASPESVYIGVKICNDGGDDMTDVFAFIGDHTAGTPGIYPTYTAPSGRPYSGTFSFHHEGGTADATRYIGDLAAGECVTQYWLLSYPLMDADGVPLFGANSDQSDDTELTYDVWATADDNGTFTEAEDSKTVTLRAELTANPNKIWPNNTNQVPGQYLSAFPDKELGWHLSSNVTHPGATISLEGNWFKLGRINKGFDNDGDYQKDYNFMIQPVGNPGIYDANCFRLVKVSGMMMINLNNGSVLEIPFEDQMHFADIPSNNTGGVGFVVYEFAVLEGGCSSELSPYQEGASGNNREKFNADFGRTKSFSSEPPTLEFEVNVPVNTTPGSQVEIEISTQNTITKPLGAPEYGAELVFQQEIPEGTFYVAGTAASNNNLPSGSTVSILYSTDGNSWETTEPFSASAVKVIQWWVDRPLQPGESADVTFEIFIPPSYTESYISVSPGLSTGSSKPFIDATGTISIQGGTNISGNVFLDDGIGGAVLGDGIQSGSENGIPGVTLNLYNDLNQSGEVEDSDHLVMQTQTQLDGSYIFNDLQDGNYIVEIESGDSAIPQGLAGTTPTEAVFTGLLSNEEVNFGFAALLKVTNTLLSDPNSFEGYPVRYKVELENLAYANNADNTNLATETAWSTQLDPATNFEYNPNNLLGAPDVALSWPSSWNGKIAAVKGFNFQNQNGEIEKVELLLSICLDYAVNNDYLTISFIGEDGSTYVVPDPVLSKTSTPSLNDYVGPPNIGLIILDVTNYQDWDWDVFDSDWTISVEGHKVSGDDGSKQYTDAIGVRVTSSCNGDSDNDGVCNNTDCYPNDPSLPGIPGTPCDDGNASTSNDVILMDGCTCAGSDGSTSTVVEAGECVGCNSSVTVSFSGCECVEVTSCKDLSNVVIRTADGTDVKYDGLSGTTGSYCTTTGSPITTVWVKSGCYQSGDGPGYGWRLDNPVSCGENNNDPNGGGGGEPGNCLETIDNSPLVYEYDPTQLEFVTSSIPPDNVSNGIITFESVGPLHTNEKETITIEFKALQPSGDSIITIAKMEEAENGCGIELSDRDTANAIIVNNLGVISGVVFGDADNDGWQGVTGYEPGVDNFIPNVEVLLYACVDDQGDLIYPAPNKYYDCTNWRNDGQWALLKSDTTDVNGVYRLGGIDNGYYYLEVDEVTLINSGQQTADPDYTNGIPSPSWKLDKRWKDPADDLRYLGQVGIGNDHANVNFGYHVASTIGGVVYHDVNGNSERDGSENPLANIKVELAHSSCTSGVNCPTTWTNGAGEYEFNQVVDGEVYTLSIDMNTLPGTESWVITDEPDETYDNNFQYSLDYLGQQVFDLNVGLQPTGDLSMGGTVYYDWSGNAHRNAGDEGMPNVEVKLYKDANGNGSLQPSDILVDTKLTDIDGGYLFADKPDEDYIIVVNENTIPVFPKQTEDPDEYGVCTVCDAKTTVSQSDYHVSVTDQWNFSNTYTNCKICDESYTSTNASDYVNNNLDIISFQDPIGSPSACVTQLKVTFEVAASDIDKSYYTQDVDQVNYHYPIELNGVQIGTFNPEELPYTCSICEAAVMTYEVDLSSIPYNFGGTNTLDMNFVSYNQTRPSNQRQDICVADVHMEFIGTGCEDQFLTLDFGYQPTGDAEIEGSVFEDENNNAFENPDDPPIDDIEVSLECDFNEDEEFHRIETTTTDTLGEFRFEDLPDGVYRVTVNPEDPDLPQDSNGDPVPPTTEETYKVKVEEGEVTRVSDQPCVGDCDTELPAFGFGTPGTIIGIIFRDENGNGTEDEREEGISNVTVYLCDAADGSCDASNAIDTVVTAVQLGGLPGGYYYFAGVMPGTYTVAVDVSTVPSGYSLTADPTTDGIPCYEPLDLADPNYAILSSGCDHMHKGIVIDYSTELTGVDFGYRPTGVLGDMVWYDDDEDGILDDNEEGLEEVEVIVRNNTTIIIDGTTYNAGDYTEVTYTDSDGNYTFSDLPDGTYVISIVPPTDHVATYDVDLVLDNSTTAVIASGEVTDTGNSWCPPGTNCSLLLDFGLTPNYTNTLEGVVCLDGDQDGRCNTGGETFPAGTEISIYDENGVFFGEDIIGIDGAYYFDNLPNANMVISVSKVKAPLNLSTMTTSLGDTPAYDMIDSDDNSLQYVAVSGNITDMDFGYIFTDTFDLGDLPAPFITEVNAVSTGPVHMIPVSPDLYLGALIDSEEFPTLRDDAEGDDRNGLNDEDGVVFSDPATWTLGVGGGSLDVEVFGNGYLVGFADFNESGTFMDEGEMIISEPVGTGTYNFNIDIPMTADLSGGQDIYFRFRLFESQPISPMTAYAGIAPKGEVEDYLVSICKNLDEPGAIIGDEVGCNGYDPSLITISHAPSGGGGNLEYQWQFSTDNGLTWQDIANTDSETYDPTYLNQSTRFRRGARREKCQDFVYSNSIVKTVVTNYTDPGAIVGNEENCGIYDPDLITSVIAPSGGLESSTPEYQWQYRHAGDPTWYNIVNANDEYLDPGVISATTEYRRGTRKSPCAPYLYSNIITKMVSVNYVDPGTISGNQSICGPFNPTEITSLSLPSGGVDGYEQIQWEHSMDNGATWSNISGATSETYNPGVITQTTMYRRKARRVPCTIWVNSNVVTKTVKPYPTASIINYPVSSGYLCELTDYEFEAEDAGVGATYTWDFSGSGNPTSADGSGPHFVQFDVPNNSALTSISVVLTTELNGCISTDNRTLTFRPEIIITSVSTVDPAACSVKDGEITVNATFPSGSTIEYSVDGGLSWDTNNNFNNLGAGVYDVRARYIGNECEERYGNVALSDPPPQADVFVSASEECTGQTVVVEAVATVGNPVFTWTFGNGAIPNTASGPGPHSVYFTQGGYANIAVTLEEAGCIGVRDTNIAIVENFTDGGTVLGGETLCSTFDPAEIKAGSNPSGGTGGTLVYQWEFRESDGAGGWTPWQDLSGSVSPNIDPGIITATTEFRRKARRSPCSDWLVSNTVTATLVTKPNLGDDTYNTVCPGFPHADNVNDNDIDLVNAEYSLLVFPTNGALDFEADGEFIYDPNSTFCGTDEFYYLVCNDGTGCCDTAHVLIDLTDTEPPNIVNVPDNLLLSCDDQIPVADAVDVTENCQSVSLSSDEFTTQGTDGCEFYNYDLIRIWNGVDYCSNSAEAQQTITIEDRTAPDIFRIYTLPNGKKMVAGVMENVSNHWKTVGLPIQFATQPIVLAQVTSQNEADPVIARLRNVSTTQFQLKLQEEEGLSGIHTQENVAWVAFERGSMEGTEAFEVTTQLMTEAVSSFDFGQTFGNVPSVFTTVQTNNEVDPVNIRLSNVTTESVDAWLQEETSGDPEVIHNLETVGFVSFGFEGNLKTLDGEVYGEIGTATVSDVASAVNFANKYHNPVVIISTIPNGDHDPVTARVTNVTSSGFEVELEEWQYLDGVHAAEQVSYLVIEGSLPFDRYVDCNNIPSTLNIGTDIIAVDNCDASIQLNVVESDYEFDCSSNTSFTRTWTTVDDCGNTTQLIQTYYLLDDEPPVFSVPEPVTIVCNANKDDLVVTGDVEDEFDNCTIDVEAVYTDNMSNVTGCGGFILRVWTATDACGNTATGTQYIYIAPEEDTDFDGIVNEFDLDDDNDGIPDLSETTADQDQDGIPNHLDLDSDNDGIPDLIEIGGKDANGDGIVDHVGEANWDFDGDGFAYGYDGNDADTTVLASVKFESNSLVNDRDGDGIANFLDLDADNDGIPDLIEAGGVDKNGDGKVDYPTPGIPTTMVDFDHDGFDDTYDPDNDQTIGVEDSQDPLILFNGQDYKGGETSYKPDFDEDMVPDFLDSDSDNDGTGDLIEAGGIDADGDAKLETDASFVDLNNDGFKDIYVTYPLVSTEEDGTNEDGRPSDLDNNGTVYTVGDLDKDGEPNHRDYDSDGDNIIDIFETGLYVHDGNADGILDSWTDSNLNGFDDVVEASANIMTEDDGLTIDGRPEDSGDPDETAYLGGAADGEFAQVNGSPDIDDDADSVPNFLDTDSDNDFLPDEKEDKNADGRQSPGETHLYNPDSDDDEIKDGIEDANRNGIYEITETDPLNPNTDGDPLLDGEEDVNFNGVVDPIESDPRDPCDPLLNEACRGLVLDIKVKLLGATLNNDTTGLMRDNMRDLRFLPEQEPYTNMSHLNHMGEEAYVEIPDSLTAVGYDPTIIGGAPGYGNGVINTTGSTYDPTGQGSYGYGYGITDGTDGHREWVNPGTFYLTGNDAPVDWVLVEIRSALQPDSIIATRAGLLQRDGDIRDIDGYSYLTFGNIPSGNFYVSIRHRNHLGVMTATPLTLSPDVTYIDFTDSNFPVFGGENAMEIWGDERVLWPGDLNGDERVIYQGPGNDVLALFQEVILAQENTETLANYILPGYRNSDFNMDGNSIFQGPQNEKAMILIYSIVGSPENTVGLANFILTQSLP